MLGLSTFFLRPVPGAAATLWILAAAPLTLLCLRKEHLTGCLTGAFLVLVVYALGLILQEWLDVRYTTAWEPHSGRSWPVLDANNAAAILNFGLIGVFYRALRQPRWFVVLAIFVAALVLTHSRAGLVAATVACVLLAAERYGARVLTGAAFLGASGILVLEATRPDAVVAAALSFADRFPIWDASGRLLTGLGLGLGTFGFYYAQVRTETTSAGFYAHNDLLQILIEAGPLGLAAVLALVAAVAVTSSRRTIAPDCALLAVFLQSLVEFQFYVPAISLLAGLALAVHRHHQPRTL